MNLNYKFLKSLETSLLLINSVKLKTVPNYQKIKQNANNVDIGFITINPLVNVKQSTFFVRNGTSKMAHAQNAILNIR